MPIGVVEVLSHDPTCYTQGLTIVDSIVIESSGLYGHSFIAEYRLESDRCLNRLDLPDSLFAEGLCTVGDTIYLLTWREHVCLLFSMRDLHPLGSFRYDGEGWGLTWDGRSLISSDGSEFLTFRDPSTFAPTARIAVTAAGHPVRNLNELEFSNGKVYSNIWGSDLIAVIDPATGFVSSLLDASGLLSPSERAGCDVLNGIAFDRGSGLFLITGKLWPEMFLVDLRRD